MDTALKALKVVNLKDILTKAGVPIPPRANKQTLISTILASKPAIDVYNKQQTDELLAPPEEVDWNEEVKPTKPSEPDAPPKPTPAATTQKKPVKQTPSATTATTTATPAASDDPELEKRRKRAERFGIPLVDSQPKPQKKAATAAYHDDSEKLNARAERFGVKPATAGRKRPSDTVDPEELEKRKKRAERFGIKPAA